VRLSRRGGGVRPPITPATPHPRGGGEGRGVHAPATPHRGAWVIPIVYGRFGATHAPTPLARGVAAHAPQKGRGFLRILLALSGASIHPQKWAQKYHHPKRTRSACTDDAKTHLQAKHHRQSHESSSAHRKPTLARRRHHTYRLPRAQTCRLSASPLLTCYGKISFLDPVADPIGEESSYSYSHERMFV
jgi:hypothetical protein